jgi:lipopolysaccharide export system permease protein
LARLTRYLLRLFWGESLALFGVAAFLLFLIQCLRLFDVVSDKGQSLWTLMGQALLGMPGLGIVFLYVCLGIGLGRALRAMQTTSELGVIHTNRLVPALLRVIGMYIAGGAIIVLILAHVLDPLSIKSANTWASSIAADLVSRAMVPHKFTELVGGVSIVIASRDSAGNISGFFADDRRSDDSHRTYFAKSAIITQDPAGYVLRMRDGAVQYLTGDHRFSEVSFTRYDLPLDNLTGGSDIKDQLSLASSIDIVLAGNIGAAAQKTLWRRTGEGLRVVAICLIVTAIAIFPTGRRRRFEVPIELAVLGTAFIERAVTSYLPLGPGILGVASGSVLLIIVAAIALLVRLRVFRPVRFKPQPA